jgi:hypothetical protein
MVILLLFFDREEIKMDEVVLIKLENSPIATHNEDKMKETKRYCLNTRKNEDTISQLILSALT